MQMDRFVFVHLGNGRPTGVRCSVHHDYDYDGEYQPGEPGRYVGVHREPDGTEWQCCHYMTDGFLSALSDEELDRNFLAQEHNELGHPEHRAGCPWCE